MLSEAEAALNILFMCSVHNLMPLISVGYAKNNMSKFKEWRLSTCSGFARGLEEVIQDSVIMRPGEQNMLLGFWTINLYGGKRKRKKAKTFSPSKQVQLFLIIWHGNVKISSLTICCCCFAFEKSMCSDHSGYPYPGPTQGCSVLSASTCTMKGKHNMISHQAGILPFSF